MAEYLIQDSTLTAIADAIRSKTGTTDPIPTTDMASTIEGIASGAYDIIATDNGDGTQSLAIVDATSGGSLITLQEKTVTPSTSAQTITPDTGYDGLSKVIVNAMTTATQATPSISVSSSGLITASATQSAGYVSSGTKSATKQLTTKAAATITPGTSNQTIASGTYLTGTQTIKGDSNLVAGNIKSGASIFGVTGSYAGNSPNLQSRSVTYTSNGTATITPDSGYDGLSSVDVTVNVSGSSGSGGGSASFDTGSITAATKKMSAPGAYDYTYDLSAISNFDSANIIVLTYEYGTVVSLYRENTNDEFSDSKGYITATYISIANKVLTLKEAASMTGGEIDNLTYYAK